jgi:hypothetical protein
MTLRNPLDHDIAKTPGSAMRYVWQGAGNLKTAGIADNPDAMAAAPKPRSVSSASPAPREPKVIAQTAPAKEPPFVMEILSGAARSEAKFDRAGEGK